MVKKSAPTNGLKVIEGLPQHGKGIKVRQSREKEILGSKLDDAKSGMAAFEGLKETGIDSKKTGEQVIRFFDKMIARGLLKDVVTTMDANGKTDTVWVFENSPEERRRIFKKQLKKREQNIDALGRQDEINREFEDLL